MLRGYRRLTGCCSDLTTNVPLQGLFFLNSELVTNQAELTAKRIAAGGGDDAARIQKAYRLLFRSDYECAAAGPVLSEQRIGNEPGGVDGKAHCGRRRRRCCADTEGLPVAVPI